MRRGPIRVLAAVIVAVSINAALALAMSLWADLGKEPKPPRPSREAVEIPLARTQPQTKQPLKRKTQARPMEAARPAMPALNLPSAITVPVFDPGSPHTGAVIHPAPQKSALAMGRETILTEDMLDEPPRPLMKTPLRYPKDAEAAGVQGEVETRLLLDTDGSVLQVRILSAQPAGIFEAAAQESLSSWRFTPATFRGQTLKAWVRQRVVFQLH